MSQAVECCKPASMACDIPVPYHSIPTTGFSTTVETQTTVPLCRVLPKKMRKHKTTVLRHIEHMFTHKNIHYNLLDTSPYIERNLCIVSSRISILLEVSKTVSPACHQPIAPSNHCISGLRAPWPVGTGISLTLNWENMGKTQSRG